MLGLAPSANPTNECSETGYFAPSERMSVEHVLHPLRFGCQEVRVASEQPTSIRLLAEETERVTARSGDFPIRGGNGHYQSRTRAGHIAAHDALL